MSRVRPGQLRFFRSAIGSTAFVLVLGPDGPGWWRCAEWGSFSWSPDRGETVLRNTAWFSHTILVSEPEAP